MNFRYFPLISSLYTIWLILFFGHQSFSQNLLEADIIVPKEIRDGKEITPTIEDYLRSGKIKPWKTKIVPYNIDPTAGFSEYQIGLIDSMAKIFERYTCVKFVPRTHEENYVQVVNGKGCSSFVGCQGKVQTMTLSTSGRSLHEHCHFEGHIQHEMMHVLGFVHEHSRADRDRYILINENNILPGKAGQFSIQKESPINIFNHVYDYGSIMHYSGYAFSKDENHLRTIIPLKNMPIGQRVLVSPLDLGKVNSFYNCSGSAFQRRNRNNEHGKNPCDFEDGLCGWTQDHKRNIFNTPQNDSFYDDFDWIRLKQSTLYTENTATKDHTTGSGYFLLATSYDPRREFVDVARIRSPVITAPKNGGPICIRFFFIMPSPELGAKAGVLTVFVLVENSRQKNPQPLRQMIWSRNGSQNQWTQAKIDYYQTEPIKILMQATTGELYSSDIAIDDLAIQNGKCLQ